MRGEVGIWLDESATTGLGVSFTGLQQERIGFFAESNGSSGSSILSRPIYNTLLDQEASQLVAYPGLVAGWVKCQTANEVYGAEVFLRRQIDPSGRWTSLPVRTIRPCGEKCRWEKG